MSNDQAYQFKSNRFSGQIQQVGAINLKLICRCHNTYNAQNRVCKNTKEIH